MVIKFNTIKVVELLRYFRKLNDVDKLRLSIHLLEDKYLHIDINKDNEIKLLEERLIELDSSYRTTIVNFSKYTNLTLLSAKFIDLSKKEQEDFIMEMLENISQNHFSIANR